MSFRAKQGGSLANHAAKARNLLLSAVKDQQVPPRAENRLAAILCLVGMTSCRLEISHELTSKRSARS